VWRFGLAQIKSSSLLGSGEVEVSHVHDGAQDCCRLPKSRTLIATPQAKIDHDVVAKFESAQPDLDEPSFVSTALEC
jgi:hypothetical protein